jgi:hypothetical protein
MEEGVVRMKIDAKKIDDIKEEVVLILTAIVIIVSIILSKTISCYFVFLTFFSITFIGFWFANRLIVIE